MAFVAQPAASTSSREAPMPRSLPAMLTLACTLLAAGQGSATDAGSGGPTIGSRSARIDLRATDGPQAGAFAAAGVPDSPVQGTAVGAYCVNVFESISFGPTCSEYDAAASAARGFTDASTTHGGLGRLFAEGSALHSTTAQAAFQIAVWRIANDAGGRYAAGSGAASLATADPAGALGRAMHWLNALPGAIQGYGLTALESRESQDPPAAVPAPSTYVLLAAGLLSIGFMARRRTAHQQQQRWANSSATI
jgi:hypothetical protein